MLDMTFLRIFYSTTWPSNLSTYFFLLYKLEKSFLPFHLKGLLYFFCGDTHIVSNPLSLGYY